MKIVQCFIVASLLFLISGSLYSQTDSVKTDEVKWEMKVYYFVFLNAVKDRPKIDSLTAMEIQKGHMANLERLYKEGKSKLAGPFMDGGDMRGIVILDVASEIDAINEMSKDPAVTNGRLELVIKQWYGPAGLYVEPKARK